MGRQKLKQLYREIEKTNDPRAAELKSALKRFLAKTEELYTYDKDGYLPPITAEKKADLVKCYKELARALDKFIEKDKEYDRKLVELVDQFAADASWDFNSLLRYDPAKELKSTATLEEENQPLRLRGSSSGIGGASKTVEIAGYLDNQGNELRGVCIDAYSPTPTKNVMNGLSALADSIKDDEFKKDFQQFVNDLPKMADENLDTLFSNFGYSPKDFASKESALVYLILKCTESEDYSRNLDSVAKGLAQLSQGKCTADKIKRDVGETALKNFMELLNKQECPPQKTDRSYIPEGSRISDGSIGVYIMANLLGVPELVPPTTRATLVHQDGKETEVIFMHEATGVDYDRAESSLQKKIGSYCIENQKDVNNAGLRAGMDMQMLSNMCYLFDRGIYNIILQFNKAGSWIGGQLIDTDVSFGAYVGRRSPCRAVTEPMAQKLEELNEEPWVSKFALWCCTPKDKRNATSKRIENEVDLIKKGKAHYEDFDRKRTKKEKEDDPYQLDPKDIHDYYTTQETNDYVRVIPVKELHRVKKKDIPYLAKIIQTACKSVFYNHHLQEKPENLDLTKHYCKLSIKPEELTGTKRRTNAVGLLTSQRALVGCWKLLGKKTSWFQCFRPSSPQYCAMQNALNDLISYQNVLLERLNDPKAAREKPITSMELIKIKELNMELEECAWDYLYIKFGTAKDSPQKKRELIEAYRGKKAKGNFRSDYERARVDAALQVLDMAQKGQNIDDEKDVAAYNTVQSMERTHYSKETTNAQTSHS